MAELGKSNIKYPLESPLLADALISKASVLQGYFKHLDLTCRCTKVTLASHQTYNLAWGFLAKDWRLEWMALVVTVVILILIYSTIPTNIPCMPVNYIPVIFPARILHVHIVLR